jgi:hypothetical protein
MVRKYPPQYPDSFGWVYIRKVLNKVHSVIEHFEHRHRFAMWTGARAAQRELASTKILCGAIETTVLRKFLRDPASLDIDAWSQFVDPSVLRY